MYKRLIAFLMLVTGFTANVFADEPVINIAADAQSADCTYDVLTTPSDPSFSTVRLRANWKANEYNVIYKPGDHAADGVVSKTDVKGATFDKPYDIWSQDDAEIYADSGYEFDGWNCSGTYKDNTVRNLIIDADNSNNNIDKYNFITDLTCTAQWECADGYDWNNDNTECVVANYNIYYKYVDDAGVEHDVSDWQGITERKHPAGYNINDNEFTVDWPVRSGYVFKGWCNGTSTCRSPDYDITINPKQMREDITLYAQWGPTDCDENEEFITNPLDDITATPVNWYSVELNGAESRDNVWNMQRTPVLSNGEWIVGYDDGSFVHGIAECRDGTSNATGRTNTSCYCHANSYTTSYTRWRYVPMTSPVEVMLPANSRCEASCASRCAETVRSGKAQSMFAGDDGCYADVYQVNFDCGSGTPNVGGPADPDSDELWQFTLASYGQNYQFYPTDKICSCPENTEFKEWSCRDENGNVNTYEAQGTISPYLYTSNLTCTAVCKETKITLNRNASKGGVTDSDPTELFTKFGIGAYLESSQTNLMSRTDHSLTTLPTGKLVNITFDANLPTGYELTDVQNMPDDISENLRFDGFYQNETIEEGVDQPLINEEGFITNEGTAAAAALEEDDTWYAQWKCVRANMNNPVLAGYRFDGWYENDDIITNMRSITRCDSTELIGSWTAYTGNLVYTCGSGNGTAPSNQQLEFDREITLASTPNACTKTGYRFDGWSCSYDIATGTQGNKIYAATEGDNNTWTVDETVVDKINEDNVTVRCDALWQANEYTITYKYVLDTQDPEPEEGLSGLTPTTYSYGVVTELPTKDDANNAVNALGYEVIDGSNWGWYTFWNSETRSLGNPIERIQNNDFGDRILYVKVKRLTCPDGYESDSQPITSKEEQCYKLCPQQPGATLNGGGVVYWPNDIDTEHCQYIETPYTITYKYVFRNNEPVTINDLTPTGYTAGPVNLPTKEDVNNALAGTGFTVVDSSWGWYTFWNSETGNLGNLIGNTIPAGDSGNRTLYVKVDLLKCPDGWNDGGKKRITNLTKDCYKECPSAQYGYTLSNPDGRVYYSAELADLTNDQIFAEQCEYDANDWEIRYDCDNNVDVEPDAVEYNGPYALKNGNEECGAKEHYTFDDWDCDNLTDTAGDHYPVNDNTQCNANWVPEEYKVDYYCVLAENRKHQDSFNIEQKYQIAGEDENYGCSANGKDFTGWTCYYTASDNEVHYVQDDDDVVPYTVTCLPDYENTTYTITYKVDGETKVHNDLNPIGYTIADNVTLPTDLPQEFLKEGYIFKEWKDEADNRVVAGWSAGDETGDKVFYVAWDCAENYVINDDNICEKKKFTVSYEPGEHGIGGTSEEVEHDSIYTLLSDSEANIVANTGYEFETWSCKTETQNDITISDNQITMPTENVICTAMWSIKCPDGYKRQENPLSQADVNVRPETDFAFKKLNGEIGANRVADTFELGGWETYFSHGTLHGTSICTSTEGRNTGNISTVNENGTGRACWCKPTKYNSTDLVSDTWIFNSNYSSYDTCVDNCTNYCAVLTRDNIGFRSGLFNLVQACVPDEYTITYIDKKTPIDNLQPSKYRYGVGATLPTTPNVTHDSYRFVEWCTGYNAETDEYSGCGQTAVSTTDTGDKVFYARWEFVCESGKWWHIDNEKVCLYADKGNSAAVSVALDSGVHYLLIKEQEDLVIHKGSHKKFRIQRGNKVYNAYDKSVLTW